MGTTAEKIQKLADTKADLKAALAGKGQTVGDVFSEYPAAVRAIETGGKKTILSVDCQPYADYITAVSSQGHFSTNSFGPNYLDCVVGELVYIQCSSLTSSNSCEEVSIPYEGGNPNPNFGNSKLLKITGEDPQVFASY